MDWHDHGIVIARLKHGESSLVVKLLTESHGLHAGLVRGGTGRAARATYQIGNRVAATWRARLADHLGNYRGELLRAHAAELLDTGGPLAALGAAAALVEATLPEREPNRPVFEAFVALLDALGTAGWAAAYARFEVALLAALGFGLDLASCAVTGETEDLAFVSPRTGRAVSRAAAGTYENRLLALPPFLIDRGESADAGSVAAALRLTGHFLARQALAPAERKMPPARARLHDAMVRRSAGTR
ncbi:MAG: DNA repair protein RecO [Defluviicoccus sp.]|nr:DNA repair protein RecO [Defluviicoccus sp.]MDE0386848.1 DNA repair protein RecO [Defluviicoccus sp.]